jgi:D-glycero-D-manno-heptose 1,7-bisphosphate phosphatase
LKALFIDRDGVINLDSGYTYKIDDFRFCDGIFETLAFFQSKDFKLIIITNQSGIARGLYREEDFDILMKWVVKKFRDNGIVIDDVYHCPHSPNDNCDCRKPKTGMLKSAIEKLNLDINKCYLIGDKDSDIEAGINIGIDNNIMIGNSTISKYSFSSLLELNQSLSSIVV